MAELNKVPGLFPRRMAVSASTTVIKPADKHFKSVVSHLATGRYALSMRLLICTIWTSAASSDTTAVHGNSGSS